MGKSGSASRSATSASVSTEASSAEAVAADEILLRQYAGILGDIKLLETKTDNLWRQEISFILPPEILENVDSKGFQGEGIASAFKLC